jgi:hypothetical protein
VVYANLATSLEYQSLVMQLFQTQPSTQHNPLALSAITMTESPEDIVSHANICIETLMRLYYMRHSYDSHHAFFIYFFMLLGNMAIETLRRSRSAPDSQKAFRQTLILCATGLESQAQSFHLANLTFRALLARVDAEDVQLVSSYCKPRDEVIDQMLVKQYAQSQWVLPIIKLGEDTEGAMLDHLLRDARKLSLEDEDAEVR